MNTIVQLLSEGTFVDLDEYEKIEGTSNTDNICRNFILTTSYWEKLLKVVSKKNEVRDFLTSLDKKERVQYFGFGIECLFHFLQANFTGPELPKTIREFLESDVFKDVDFRKLLCMNNEEINCNTKYPALLLAAKCIFKYCNVCLLLNLWWQCRGIMIHQHVLEELSPDLLRETEQIEKSMRDLVLDERTRAKFHIEQARLYHLFRCIHNSEEHVAIAKGLLKFDFSLIGKLGKRTQFQEESIAQLMLEVNLANDKSQFEVPKTQVPHNVALNNDLHLENISFDEGSDQKLIPDLEQTLLLAFVDQMLISKPQDSLYFEEIKPFIDVLLTQNNTWALRTMVLLIRSKVEAKNKHTIERCLLQYEEVLSSIKKESPYFLCRLNGLFATNLKPIWKVEAELAEVMLTLGMVKSSLDIYLRIKLWEEVILCYTILNMRHKAAEIIKQQLEVNPTIKLWCLLGDATEDVTCYEKAWKLSNGTSSRAQRHWGQYFYSAKQYKESVPHFEKSLSINYLQKGTWLRYGFAALETENWSIAATAYKRYTSLEIGNFEVWNNLAKAYIKLNNKHAAHKALHEAIKCNYENWKVWDNLMVVSADLGNYTDIIRAYHRILDLKEKHLDVEVLGALVYGVCNNINHTKYNADGMLMQKARELLGRVTSVYPANGHAWELYASLAPDVFLRVQRLQRALSSFMSLGWEKDTTKSQQVLYVCHKLGEAVLNDQIQLVDPVLNNVKRNISSVVVAVGKQDFEESRNLLNEVNLLLSQVQSKVELANNQKRESN